MRRKDRRQQRQREREPRRGGRWTADAWIGGRGEEGLTEVRQRERKGRSTAFGRLEGEERGRWQQGSAAEESIGGTKLLVSSHCHVAHT